MLNFINIKFVKIIISNITLGYCFTNNIYAYCKKDKNKDNENNKKKGYSGKNKNNKETITDQTENQDNKTNTNINGDKNKENNVNKENLIKNKKENLLKRLEQIKNDNEYLNDKIEKQIINNLKNKIENLNNNDISNIENELNNLRNTVNSKLDRIKKNYIDSVVDINNSIEILENYDNNKYKLQKYTLNVYEVNNKKFNEIKDLNDVLDEIKKNYNKSINEIVSKLKSEFEILKKQETDDNKLDVNDEDFNNLIDVLKIIDIDKKLFTYENIINNNKEEIINKINPINEKLEKHSKLLKLLKIEFEKETNLDNKNIEDLCNLYGKLTNINNDLINYINSKKIDLNNKYQSLYTIYNKYKTKLELEEINIDFNINNYNLDNYEDFENKIKEFENNIKQNIDNLEQKLNNKYKEIIKNCKNKNLKYENFSFKIVNNLDEKYEYLADLDKYLEELEYELKFSVNRKILDEKELENYYKDIEGLQRNLEKNNDYSYSGSQNGDGTLRNYIEIGDNVEENLNNFINNKLSNIRLYHDIGVKQGNGDDFGAIRKQFYEESTEFILNELNIKEVKLIETKKDCLAFNTIDKKNKTEYNMFSTESTLSYYDYINYIKLLALFCVNSLQNQNGCNTLFLNLNPLIYKIMLNYDNLENADPNNPNIKENLSNILNYDDLRYYECNTWGYLLDRKEKKDKESDELFEERYTNMVNNFVIQFPKIKQFYYYLKHYFREENLSKIKNFSGNDYWKLKYFLEGENIIKYDKLINCINKDTCLAKRFIEINVEKQEIISIDNAKAIYDIFLDILKNFSNEQLLSFLRWSTGSKSLPIGKKIYFEFVKSNDPKRNLALLSSHSCYLYFSIAVDTIKKKIEQEDVVNYSFTDNDKNTIKEYFKYELSNVIECNKFTIG